MKCFLYHHSIGYSNKGCYEQQSESAYSENKKRWYTYHKSGSHSDDQCYHQRNSSRNPLAESKSTKKKRSLRIVM